MSAMSHWAEQYVGRPWVAGAQGPDAFDCWAFFRHVQAAHFGIAVPPVEVEDYDNAAALVALLGNHPERGRWARVTAPTDGDGVIIHRPLHVGVWLAVDGGGVLHCVRGAGVVFTPDARWAVSGFGRREFRTFRGAV